MENPYGLEERGDNFLILMEAAYLYILGR